MTGTNWRPDLSRQSGPKYQGLARALRDAIRSGELPEGAQLPTVRDLAWSLDVTPGTVSRAYQLATQEGLLAATVGRGTFVAARAPKLGPTQSLFIEREPAQLAGRVDLRAPQLPDVGQGAAFAEAMTRIGPAIGADWIDYPGPAEDRALRHSVVEWLSDRVLGPFDAGDIALTHGGQNAISLIFLCCLRGDRPVVLTEELAYPGFRHAARLARAEVVGVETDAEGMVPEALEAACRRHGPQVLCLTTEAQNPTTARMGPERRARIAAIARAFDLQVIEDDCYSLITSDWPAIRALAPERTWHVGSLSKTVSAALRFGYIVCPTGMGEAGRLTAQHAFFSVSRPVVDLVQWLFRSGRAAELRAAGQAELDWRLEVTVRALGGVDLSWQPGLRFVFLRLPSGWRASTFLRMAEARGVLLRSADEYAPIHGRAPNAVRLALSGRAERDRFEAALATLAELLRSPAHDLAV